MSQSTIPSRPPTRDADQLGVGIGVQWLSGPPLSTILARNSADPTNGVLRVRLNGGGLTLPLFGPPNSMAHCQGRMSQG